MSEYAKSSLQRIIENANRFFAGFKPTKPFSEISFLFVNLNQKPNGSE